VQKPDDRGELGMRREPLPQEIFDRLDVVVGARLDGLDPLGVVLVEALDEVIEKRLRLRTERGDLGYLEPAREALEPADLDQDSMPDEPVFTENGPQRFGLPGIAAVRGRDRGEGGKVHGRRHVCDVEVQNCFSMSGNEGRWQSAAPRRHETPAPQQHTTPRGLHRGATLFGLPYVGATDRGPR
jgi:hypothetical protein